MARQYPDEMTLIAIGPLTNLALAIQKDPEGMRQLKEIVIMGGEHPSFMAEETLRDCPAIDYVCVGEGEVTLTEFLRTIEKKEDLLYLVFRHYLPIVTQAVTEKISHLDDPKEKLRLAIITDLKCTSELQNFVMLVSRELRYLDKDFMRSLGSIKTPRAGRSCSVFQWTAAQQTAPPTD
jgi:hypothetical protein